MSQNVDVYISHLSERPWSNYTKADYSIEQWHSACLIHLHTGSPTSKNQCKLPVRTPNGALNKNGIFAAAAALAGARGGVQASAEQKASAARKLRSYYRQMNAKPPPSLASHSDIMDFIEHHGIKGMKWGIRNPRNRVSKSKARRSRTVYQKKPKHLTSAQLEARIRRMEAEKKYNQLNKRDISRGQQLAGEILANSGRAVASTVLTGAALYGVKHVVRKKMGHEAASMITKRK